MDPGQHDRAQGYVSGTPEDDGADYLRRLKQQPDWPAATDPVPTTRSMAPMPQIGPEKAERRRSPRYSCNGSAEFRAAGGDVRMWGTLTDISRHGCYVEMTSTFPAGTDVDLGMEVQGIRVRARGRICVSYPFLGMGIAFTEIAPEQEASLEQLLSALAEHRGPPIADPGLKEESGVRETVAAAAPNALLDEIVRFFAVNRLLSREEFIRIARQARRS
ncbi:MAG: PilZ domain-containing protein [Terriglobales bacterium]